MSQCGNKKRALTARFLFFLADIDQAAARAVFHIRFFAHFWIPGFLRTGLPLFLRLTALVDLDKREDHRRHYYERNKSFHKSSICNVDVVDSVFLNHQIINDKLLALSGVLSHVIRQ